MRTCYDSKSVKEEFVGGIDKKMTTNLFLLFLMHPVFWAGYFFEKVLHISCLVEYRISNRINKSFTGNFAGLRIFVVFPRN